MSVFFHHSIDKSFVSWASLLDSVSPIAGKAFVKSLPPGLFILIGAPKLLLPFADWGFATPDVFCFDCLKERCGVSEDLIDLHTNTQPCIKSSLISYVGKCCGMPYVTKMILLNKHDEVEKWVGIGYELELAFVLWCLGLRVAAVTWVGCSMMTAANQSRVQSCVQEINSKSQSANRHFTKIRLTDDTIMWDEDTSSCGLRTTFFRPYKALPHLNLKLIKFSKLIKSSRGS